MKKKPSVLFVLDKWCEGNPNYGTSEWESNLWESLESSGLTTCETFHFDEYYHLYQQAGDDALVRKCLDYKPDMVCLVIYKIPGSDFNVPTLRTLEIVRHQLNISTVAIWGDLQSPQQVEISKMILPFVDFNVCTASSATVSRIGQSIKTSQKYTYFWVPKDSRCFYNPGIERGIPIGYVGSPKPERLSAIDSLRRSGIDVYQTGGERRQHISAEQYAQILMRSKIGLSFSRSGHSHVTNARTFEATLCGAMLLEEEGFETAKLFIPFVDYVPYSSHKDLVEKAKYYLTHDHERQAIADNGCRRSHENYSATRFWRIVLNRALKSTNSEPAFDGNTFELTPERLSKLPLSRSLKLRLLNRACSNVVVHTGISDLQRLVKWPFKIISSYTRPAERFLRTLVKGTKGTEILRHYLEVIGAFSDEHIPQVNHGNKSAEIIEIGDFNYTSLDCFIYTNKYLSVDQEFISLAKRIHSEGLASLSVREMWNLYNLVKKTSELQGDIAEVGVLSGGSAKIICETENKKKVHLFDTFTGIPFDSEIDAIKKGDVSGDSLPVVKQYLSKYENVFFYPGVFPDTAAGLDDQANFSLVHLDVDTYRTTKESLEYFYPRMTKKGIILTHDYRASHLPGVKKAFDEFFDGRPETIIELWDSQAIVVKC